MTEVDARVAPDASGDIAAQQQACPGRKAFDEFFQHGIDDRLNVKIEESILFRKPIRSLSRWYGNLARDEVKGEALRTRIRMCVAPAKTKRRLATARPFLSSEYDSFRRNGHLAMRLPRYDRLAPVFRQIIEESLAGDRPQAGSKKNLINLLKPEHLTGHPEIMDAIFDDAFLQPVFNYYGYAPELASLGLFLTPQNEDVEKSQLWHIDSYDPHHLKHITLVEDVTMDNGPFTFLPIPESNAIRQEVGKLSRGLDFESKFADRLRNNIVHVAIRWRRHVCGRVPMSAPGWQDAGWEADLVLRSFRHVRRLPAGREKLPDRAVFPTRAGTGRTVRQGPRPRPPAAARLAITAHRLGWPAGATSK